MSTEPIQDDSTTEVGATEVNAPDPSKAYLEALLARIRVPSQMMRFHLGEQDQNTTLGLAAEIGIRDVLRQVLPSRFGITSGFMCQGNGRLIHPAGKDDISPQTDVILYDASRACPLYKMGDVEVVTATDVLGIVEVKDRANGEDSLDDVTVTKTNQTTGEKSTKTTPGALRHIKSLAEIATAALRVIILLRGDGSLKNKKHIDKAREKCDKFDATLGFGSQVPHIIYCVEHHYIVFYEYLTNQLHFIQYADRTDALADFLHVLTSYFVAQQLSTTSSSLGLLSDSRKAPTSESPMKLKGRDALKSLRDEVWNCARPLANKAGLSPDMDAAIRKWAKTVKTSLELFCFPATGKSKDGWFTSGIAVVALWKDGNGQTQHAGSFFVYDGERYFECVDPIASETGDQSTRNWLIAYQSPEANLLQTCRKIAERIDPFKRRKVV